MLTTHAEVINQDLLAFIRSQECEAASGTVNEAPGRRREPRMRAMPPFATTAARKS